MAAGGYKYITVLVLKQPLVFAFYYCGSDSGFLRISKAQLFERRFQLFKADTVIIGYK